MEQPIRYYETVNAEAKRRLKNSGAVDFLCRALGSLALRMANGDKKMAVRLMQWALDEAERGE